MPTLDIAVSVQDRDGNELAAFTFTPDARPPVIELYDRTGRTVSTLDPLCDQIRMVLPTHTEPAPAGPVIDTVAPTTAAANSGDVTVTLTGTGFGATGDAFVDGADATYMWSADTYVQTIIPNVSGQTAHAVEVYVVDNAGNPSNTVTVDLT